MIVVAFAVALLVAVLLSELAKRTILSTPVLFLVVGFAVGPGALDLVELQIDGAGVTLFVTITIAVVLFTDGLQLSLRDLAAIRHLPSRALLLGMPLTVLLVAVLASLLVGVPWSEALLVAAVLSPTDPVFASAIISRLEVPERLRRLLSVESGLNDGLALPLVLALLAVVGPGEAHLSEYLGEIVIGLAIGVGVPWLVLHIERLWRFSAADVYERLLVLAIGLLVFSLSEVTGGNVFIATYVAGVGVATLNPNVRDSFMEFGDTVAELLKLGSLLIFGTMLSIAFFGALRLADLVFAALVLLIARPVAMGVALLGTDLGRRERLAAAWFGPRGLASVVYALLVLQSGIERAQELVYLIAVAIVASMVAHASTDVLVARWFRPQESESG